MKKLIVLCCLLSLVGCSSSQKMPELDPVATAQAPWEPGETITRGQCSSSSWCVRIFHGMTVDHKILVQEFHTQPNVIRSTTAVHDPYTGIITRKYTDPYTILTVEDAKLDLFEMDNGKDGEYRRYPYSGWRVSEKGTYRNGLKEGHWYYHLSKGVTIEGDYVAGQRHGIWVYRFGWMKRTEIEYDHGERVYKE